MFSELFKIGPVIIRSYGAIVAMALCITFVLLYKDARKKNFYADQILDLEFLILVSGIAGARILHVLVNLDFYRDNILDVFMIWRGGLAFYGALILAIIASWIFMLKKRMPVWKTVDFIAPYIALGQSIGRIGCLLNGCCFGAPTTSKFFGVMFPGDIITRHPTQAYASVVLLIIFVVLLFVRKRNIFPGFTFLLFLGLYSLQRFFIDFLRADTQRFLFNFTVSQMISVAIFFLTLVLIYGRIRSQSRRKPRRKKT